MSVSQTIDLSLTGSQRRIDRIDVHAHFIPDFYRQVLIEEGLVTLARGT
jgi:hypothetical protein